MLSIFNSSDSNLPCNSTASSPSSSTRPARQVTYTLPSDLTAILEQMRRRGAQWKQQQRRAGRQHGIASRRWKPNWATLSTMYGGRQRQLCRRKRAGIAFRHNPRRAMPQFSQTGHVTSFQRAGTVLRDRRQRHSDYPECLQPSGKLPDRSQRRRPSASSQQAKLNMALAWVKHLPRRERSTSPSAGIVASISLAANIGPGRKSPPSKPPRRWK